MPIYYVIFEGTSTPPRYIMIAKILKVVACDLDDIDRIYNKEVAPLQHNSGRNIQTMIFYREPPNPIQQAVDK